MNAAQHHRRRELIAGLRALAAFLDSHPQVPVPRYGAIRVSVHTNYDTDATTEPEAIAEVERIAALLGTTPTVEGGHHVAGMEFGSVRYEAVLVTRAAMARRAALDSYSDAITLDEIEEA
ncbi:hypothetical protein [Planobispora longispora]|uniref:Uncharacterized protein n=1 Tax=Planobispora longispora TaxID=28887 RepID=A0A8J3W775_9ACTN|nr:hypothetical protein [Planobispora longispora]BFE83762.1 hypothetical protein GCM10020093_063630 [Planobispora longispora]GIH78303.1 hypothetical protein Plo01_47320 [Planobispora longispora]